MFAKNKIRVRARRRNYRKKKKRWEDFEPWRKRTYKKRIYIEVKGNNYIRENKQRIAIVREAG